MKPEKLSLELRKGTSEFLAKRRSIIALSMASIFSNSLISLYQIGIIKHLPEPPLPAFDADKVDASGEAYHYFEMPDAFIALGSYATTMALTAMGGQDRAKQQPWIPLLLLAKIGFDVIQAGKLSVDQWTKHKAFCFWCLLSSVATFATLPLVVPEARAAIRQVFK